MRFVLPVSLYLVSGLYALLSLAAAAVQWRKEKKLFPALLMAVGALLLTAAVFCCLFAKPWDIWFALTGCTAICAAALWNGVKSGQLHLHHHIIRLALSLVLLAGFALL